MLSGRNIPRSVERIRRHGILVVGSFIVGLDTDHVGVGKLIADAAGRYGVDSMNVLFLTPLPGTRLWEQVSAEGRIALGDFPDDWKYYTLNFPVAHYKYLTRDQVVREMNECNSTFYSVPNIVERLAQRVLAGRNPLFVVVSSLTSRKNSMLFAAKYEALWPAERSADGLGSDEPGVDAAGVWQKVTEQSREIVATLKLQVSRFWGQS
jgi:radical SAM superfamily enzyme YgiQ (UPF0313 family)